MVSKQTVPTSSTSSIAACRSKDNRLSTGYLAHEFLTEVCSGGNGTQQELKPIPSRWTAGVKGGGGTIMARTQQRHSSYADVANLL
ncbi:hypothetical protein MKX03_037207 [Papaver bracteatum]|nr:hypothetical protein MKX03_037207 [Papaver bracteatum]